jgi:endonuclease/exonuclease/phosphatase family metal-dependent hydrolase
MHKRLHGGGGRRLSKSARAGAALAGFAVIVLSAGCASNRPAPILLEGHALAAPVNSAGDDSRLKLVTYNIWGLPSWMTGARSGRYPQIARELKRLDPDVVLLQEAWTADARGAAPKNGHWVIARAARQNTFFQQCGLVTLSRFPVIGGEFYPFSRAAMPDRLVNKGVLKVCVQIGNGQVLNIWNVHLQDGGSDSVRMSQVRELVARVEMSEDGQVADVVAGDFNCTPDSALYHELSESFGASVQELGHGQPFVTWDGLSPKSGTGQTLDHIFIRRRGRFQGVEANARVAFAAPREERLSDHFGIEATINLVVNPMIAGPAGSPVKSRQQPRSTDLNVYAAGE